MNRFSKIAASTWMRRPGSISDEMLARYVRDESRPEEREAVEAAYFSDESVHERLMALEEELFDEYARGHLSGEPRERFEALHLCSPANRERLSFSRALCQFIDQHPTAQAGEEVAQSGAILKAREVLKAFWSLRLLSPGSVFLRLAFPLAVIAILLAAIVIPLRTRRWESHAVVTKVAGTQQKPPSSSSVQPPHAEAPPQRHVRSQEGPTVFAFTLVPSARDAGGGVNTIRVPAVPATIRLKMAIENGSYARYRVSIQKQSGGRKLTFAMHQLARRTRELYVDIPSDRLEAGDYVLELWALVPNQPPEEVAGYAFRIETGR